MGTIIFRETVKEETNMEDDIMELMEEVKESFQMNMPQCQLYRKVRHIVHKCYYCLDISFIGNDPPLFSNNSGNSSQFQNKNYF